MKSLYVTHILEQEIVALGGSANKAGGIFLRLSTTPHAGGQTLDIEISQDTLQQVVALVSEKRIVASAETLQNFSDDEWGPDASLEDYEFDDTRQRPRAPANFQADEALEAPDHDDDMAVFTPAE